MSKSTAVFTFQNVGDTVLKITHVQKCCGAVIRLDKDEYRSGENGFLMATYQVGQGPADFNKVIRLFTNDPSHPQVNLTAAGNIIETLAWTPTRLELPLSKNGTTSPEIRIRSLDGSLFSIKGYVATGNCLTAAFDPNVKARELIIKPQLNLAKAEALVSSIGTVRITLDHPDYREISLSFTVIPPIQAIPPQIVAFYIEPGKSFVRALKIQVNDPDPNQPTPLEVASISTQNGAQAKIRNQIENWSEVTLEILPAKNRSSSRFITDEMTLQLKNGTKLTIPLRLFNRTQVQSESTSSTNPSLRAGHASLATTQASKP